MKYELYEATDKRDGQKMLWLRDCLNGRVATFCLKWAPSRIRNQAITSPETIVWTDQTAMIVHADLPAAVHLATWEFSL